MAISWNPNKIQWTPDKTKTNKWRKITEQAWLFHEKNDGGMQFYQKRTENKGGREREKTTLHASNSKKEKKGMALAWKEDQSQHPLTKIRKKGGGLLFYNKERAAIELCSGKKGGAKQKEKVKKCGTFGGHHGWAWWCIDQTWQGRTSTTHDE